MNAKEAAAISGAAKTVKLDSNLDVVFKSIKLEALQSNRKTSIPISRLPDPSKDAIEALRVYMIDHGYSIYFETTYMYISW
jgi:hypothetical protein